MREEWGKQIMAELERLNRSKEALSSGILEKSADPKKEGIGWKSSEARIEVPAESAEKTPNHGEELKPSWATVANLAKRIKKTMVEIRGLTQSSQGRFKDLAFGQEFHRKMTEHIDNSEADLNSFLDYIRIKSPVGQKNMLYVILEEALEKHKKKLMAKEIKIFRKQYEKDMPEARVHVEELRFILNWVLEYAIISSVPNRSIGFLTRSLEVQGGTKSIEILIVLGDDEKPSKQIEVPLERERNCILLLVDEIVQKNRGLLKLSTDSEGHLRMISLRLPIERRKVIYYQPALA